MNKLTAKWQIEFYLFRRNFYGAFAAFKLPMLMSAQQIKSGIAADKSDKVFHTAPGAYIASVRNYLLSLFHNFMR